MCPCIIMQKHRNTRILMKKYGIQLVTIFLMLLLAVLLVISSKYFIGTDDSSGKPSTNPSVTAALSDNQNTADNNSAEGTDTPSDTSIVTADPAKLIDTNGSNP